jgi:(p)ppGpp synthase/HD superfamily hydrolase
MADAKFTMVGVAIPFAAKAFVGKFDKTGREDAIMHSLRVERLVAKSCRSDITQAAALLHDTIEDTYVTEASIREEFAAYPAEDVEKLVAAVLSVTRGYINRETRTMTFSPPPNELVCDCRSAMSFKCVNPCHTYDKETYREFVMRSKRNPLGRIIKIADITDNMSPARTEGLPEDERGIVEERYVPALAFLRDNNATEFYTQRQLDRLCEHCHSPFAEHVKTNGLCAEPDLFGKRRKFKGVRS